MKFPDLDYLARRIVVAVLVSIALMILRHVVHS